MVGIRGSGIRQPRLRVEPEGEKPKTGRPELLGRRQERGGRRNKRLRARTENHHQLVLLL